MDNKNSYRSHAAALIVIHNSRRDKNHRHFGMDAEMTGSHRFGYATKPRRRLWINSRVEGRARLYRARRIGLSGNKKTLPDLL